MLWELSTGWLIAVNILAWGVVHMATAWGITQLAAERFEPAGWLHRPRRWEQGGWIYERWLRVQRWKHRLPDGAALFRRGFRKKRFLSRDPAYLRRFVHETCRGELVHWSTVAAAPLFFLWNPPQVGAIMILYALLASLPFIVVQRYNRFRLERMLGRRERVPRGGADARITRGGVASSAAG